MEHANNAIQVKIDQERKWHVQPWGLLTGKRRKYTSMYKRHKREWRVGGWNVLKWLAIRSPPGVHSAHRTLPCGFVKFNLWSARSFMHSPLPSFDMFPGHFWPEVCAFLYEGSRAIHYHCHDPDKHMTADLFCNCFSSLYGFSKSMDLTSVVVQS